MQGADRLNIRVATGTSSYKGGMIVALKRSKLTEMSQINNRKINNEVRGSSFEKLFGYCS
jgi:hypothetical protein